MGQIDHAEAASRIRDALKGKPVKAKRVRIRVQGQPDKFGIEQAHVELDSADILAVAEAAAQEHAPALCERSAQQHIDPNKRDELPPHPELHQVLQDLHYGSTGAQGTRESCRVTIQASCAATLLSLYDEAHAKVQVTQVS